MLLLSLPGGLGSAAFFCVRYGSIAKYSQMRTCSMVATIAGLANRQSWSMLRSRSEKRLAPTASLDANRSAPVCGSGMNGPPCIAQRVIGQGRSAGLIGGRASAEILLIGSPGVSLTDLALPRCCTLTYTRRGFQSFEPLSRLPWAKCRVSLRTRKEFALSADLVRAAARSPLGTRRRAVALGSQGLAGLPCGQYEAQRTTQHPGEVTHLCGPRVQVAKRLNGLLPVSVVQVAG